ncbi:MAG: class I SAM-dependent methyltransferase [Myxococcaceae bacterium]
MTWYEAALLIPVVVLAALTIVYTLRLGAGPVPSNRAQIDAMLTMLAPIDASPIYELGAGFGRLAFAVSARFPERQVVAIELSPVPYWGCRLQQLFRKRPNLTFRRADFLKLPLNDAKVLLTFVHTTAMAALADKLTVECKGAHLLSHTFSVRGWTPVKTARVADLYNSPVYLFRVS